VYLRPGNPPDRVEPGRLIGREAAAFGFQFSENDPVADEAEVGETGPVGLDRGPPAFRRFRRPEMGDPPADQEAAADERRKLAEPVVFDDFEEGPSLTLREAGEAVHQAGGRLEVVGSRLVVSIPPGVTRYLYGKPSAAMGAARRLYAAEEAVLAAAGKGGAIDVSKLPDGYVLPSGALAP
jgi:hypothetical protein